MLNSYIHIDEKEKLIDVLRVIQLCDSNFPIGSFNHSYGMETYLRNNMINDKNTIREYLKVYLNNVFIYSDGLSIKMLYRYLNEDDFDKIWILDRELTVQSIAKETRNGSKLVASRMLVLFQDLYSNSLLKRYDEMIKKDKAFGHPAIVFGMLMYSFGFTEEEAITFHMYSTISTLIQNAVRAIPLGQKEGQLIMKECSESFHLLYEKIKTMDDSMLGATTPGIELSQINHEVLEFRLFMS